MTADTYEWNELSDTRELLEARTPRFISWFLGIFLLLLAVGIGWSCWYSIDIVVKAQAVVRPNSRISTVSSNVQGKVTEILYRSGEHVKQGDVLLRIGLDNMPKQKQDLQAQYEDAVRDLNALSSDLKQAESGAAAKSWDTGKTEAGQKWKVSFEQNEYEREQSDQQLTNDSRLLDSIARSRNLFASSELYHEKYEAYRLKLEQLEAAKDTAAKAYKLDLRADEEASADGNNAYANAQRDLDSYRSQYLVDLNTSIEDSHSKLRQLALDRDSLLVQLQEAMENAKQQTKDLNHQLADFGLQISERTVKAPISGVINSVQPMAVGDLVEAGAQILNIVPEDGSEYIMQLAVANKDIGSVRSGTPIKYDFLALPAKDYGHLEGAISWLGPDALTDSDTGQSYYSGEATLLGHTLRDKQGKLAEVKVGMVAEAQMITDRETVMNWLLKKIDLRG